MELSNLLGQLVCGKWFLSFNGMMTAMAALELFLSRIDFSKIRLDDPDSGSKPFDVVVAAGGKKARVAAGDYDEVPKGSTAIIPLQGVMLKGSSRYNYGTEGIANFMVAAGEHRNISSVVMKTHSGGGAVDSVAPLVDAIGYVRRGLGKPVVGNFDLGCSAAYWALSECDLVLADNAISSEVGSVGVMMSFLDAMPFYEEKLKMNFHQIYGELSEGFKNRAFRLALEGKYDLIREEELNPLERCFQDAIKRNRGDRLDLGVEGIIYGRTFFAGDALRHGLIDGIANLDGAVAAANDLALKKEIKGYNFQ